jgi:precorrin-2/cobalt-factor-2 C20-methyltransferase
VSIGTLYGISVGPGDPDLITVKAVKILNRCRHVFAPRAKTKTSSMALDIAHNHIRPDAAIYDVEFPMTADEEKRAAHWQAQTADVAAVLQAGHDACYLTLGDALLYSTFGHMAHALRDRVPDLTTIIVPGVTSFSAGAAEAGFPLGRRDGMLTVCPVGEDLEPLRKACALTGTIVLMKIGRKLHMVIDFLEDEGLLDTAVLVSRAGLDGRRVEPDLRKLREEDSDVGNLAVILIDCHRESRP